MNPEFETKILYVQNTMSDEDISISSQVFNASWFYPGAKSKTIERIRITAVYTPEKNSIFVRGGMVEKWSSGGWLLLDEHTDNTIIHKDLEHMVNYLLKIAESFITGMPLNDIIDDDFIANNENEIEDVNYENVKVLEFNKNKKE